MHEIDTAQQQRIVLHGLESSARETDRQRTMRRSRRVQAHGAAEQPRCMHLGSHFGIGVEVELEQEPHVREACETLERLVCVRRLCDSQPRS